MTTPRTPSSLPSKPRRPRRTTPRPKIPPPLAAEVDWDALSGTIHIPLHPENPCALPLVERFTITVRFAGVPCSVNARKVPANKAKHSSGCDVLSLRFGFGDPMGAAMRALFSESYETLRAARLDPANRGRVPTLPQSEREALALTPADGENVYDASALPLKHVSDYYANLAKSEWMRKRRIRAAEKRAAKAEKTKLWYEKKAVWEEARMKKEAKLRNWRKSLEERKAAKAERAMRAVRKPAEKKVAKPGRQAYARSLDEAVEIHIAKIRQRSAERMAKLRRQLAAGTITRKRFDHYLRLAEIHRERQQKLRDEFAENNPGKTLWHETVAKKRAANAAINQAKRDAAK